MSDTGGRKRTRKQREYDLEEISGLYLKGWFQSRIVDHLAKGRSYRISQQTISNDIAELRKRWMASSVRNFDEAKANELAKIDHLEMTAWQAYEASMKPIIKQRTSKKVDGQVTEATQEATRGYGDPRFLDMIYRCIDKRCKLLGLDAPIKQQNRNYEIDLNELDDNQLKRLAAGEDIVNILASEG